MKDGICGYAFFFDECLNLLDFKLEQPLSMKTVKSYEVQGLSCSITDCETGDDGYLVGGGLRFAATGQ